MDNLLLQKYNDYIRLKNCRSEYLLSNGMRIAKDPNTQNRYIETFFHQPTDMYIKDQTIVKVKTFTLYSPDNHIIVTDSF